MKYFGYAFLYLNLFCFSLQAQQVTLQGIVVNSAGKPIADVSIYSGETTTGAVTDSSGFYKLQLTIRDSIQITFHHLAYQPFTLTLNQENYNRIPSRIVLKAETTFLEEVAIKDEKERNQVSVVEIEPLDAKMIPSAFNDFNKVLSTLPGVVSNNELSSSYSVRGGNFDENLVYVNDIPIYRPFLVRSGQQEGLSFVNSDLVSNISFSAGGWQAKYGDKLSSSLNISYKNPKKNSGSFTMGLLGGAAHVALYSKKKRAGALIGVRHKNSQYLLNTLETSGEYLPSFSDIQVLLSKDLDESGNTTLEILSSYARNRYLVKPESQATTFGTTSRTMRLNVFFQGNELMEYDTYQTGVKLSHLFSQRFVSDIILSGLYTLEREYYDVEGAYRLCEVNSIPGSRQEECITISGVGTNYRYARNRLNAKILNMESRNTYFFNSSNMAEFGVGVSTENIEDLFREYSFSDSSDFVTINNAVNAEADLSSIRLTGYVQNTTALNLRHTLTYGLRFNYWDLNEQFLVSPRIQYAYDPGWEEDIILRAAFGLYQQPPFYRELRDNDGRINKTLKAQSSLHHILGFDYNFKIWGRNFKWVTEAYYKYIKNAIPYEVDNVRIRYSAMNNAKAYAAGLDIRVSGEFIEGAQSWFSLGLLSTRINIEQDEKGYIRRPSDQRVNLGIFFQDHLPNDPSIRMYLSLLFGSGLPFGPPENEDYRNAFTGKAYRRVDIGFSKIFEMEEKKILGALNSFWIGAEVLNLLGTRNVLSYTWVADINNQQFAVPNTLSARFLNIKVVGKF